MKPCVYVTSGWGVHDDRWVAALDSQGFAPTIIRFGIDVSDIPALRTAVAHAASSSIPVLAGPLDSITSALIGIDAPIVGLSWGFDLHAMTDRRWLPELTGLIVDSQATAEIAREAGMADEAITFLPWGTDLETFTPEGPLDDFTRWGVPKGARTIVSLRAHEPLYRVHDVISGFALVAQDAPDVHLIIGHTGSLTPDLRAQARDLGIDARTHFIGALPESDLPALLRSADVYVSASEVDGTSVTLLQAMACRTLILASDSQGNRPWVQPDVTGYLFETGDPTDLAQGIKRLLTASAEDKDTLTARARSLVVDQADWGTNVGRLRGALTMAAS